MSGSVIELMHGRQVTVCDLTRRYNPPTFAGRVQQRAEERAWLYL
ncbi:MAG TPA: hypothetical protein PKJ02_06025 [Candidatus Avimonas sp.]|nr:hypothetical protein [Candidatus Avimonas sp.]